MRLTTFTDYTLRVLIYLAARPGRRATIGDVARSFEISEHHVAKVVHFLGAAGWLENVRGRGGGMQLAQPPAQINVADVVRLAEGSDVPAECFGPGGSHCNLTEGCRLRGVFAQAVQEFYAALGRYTLADLVMADGAARAVVVIPAGHRAAASTGSAST